MNENSSPSFNLNVDGNISGTVDVAGRDIVFNYYGVERSQSQMLDVEEAALIDFLTSGFVGRTPDVAGITRWLETAPGGYHIIQAGPGTGKSALSAELIRRHKGGEFTQKFKLSYAFIRHAGGRDEAPNAQARLNQQWLAHLKAREGVPVEVERVYRQAIAILSDLREKATTDSPWLVILDGLDELKGENADLQCLLPESLPPHVYYLLTTRPNPPLVERVPPHHTLALPQTAATDLTYMTVDDAREMLRLAGGTYGRSKAFLEEMVEIANGEALLLRFLAEDIVVAGPEGEKFLRDLPPLRGVADYFTRQMRLLEELAEADETWDVLGTLAVARSGLTQAELASVLGMPLRKVRHAMMPILRFLIGGQGERSRYELMHAELRRVALNGEFISKQEQQDYLNKLIIFCAAWTDHKSPYALENYAAHLHETGRRQELYDLLTSSSGWMQAKFAATGSDASFLVDVELGMGDFAEPFSPEALLTYTRLHMARQAVNYRTNLYEDDDLRVLTLCGQKEKALAFARLRNDPERRAQGLRVITTSLLETDLEDGVATYGAIRVSKEIEDTYWHIEMLRELIVRLAEGGQCDRAIEVARGIEDVSERANALWDVTGWLAESEQRDRALTVLDEVLEATRGIKGVFGRAKILGGVARVLAAAGQHDRAFSIFDEALEVAQGIEGAFGHAAALGEIAERLAEAGRRDQAFSILTEALEIARGIESTSGRTGALQGVAASLVEIEHYERAIEVVREIQGVSDRAWALREIARKLAEVGQHDRALNVVREVDEAPDRAWALHIVTKELANAGQHDRALEMIQEIKDSYLRTSALQVIARKLATAGQYDRALDVARGIEDVCERARALQGIIVSLVEAGQHDCALDLAREIEDDTIHAATLRESAVRLAEARQCEQALSLLAEALKLMRGIEGTSAHAEALQGVAVCLAEVGQYDRALDIARNIESWQRASAVGAIAVSLAGAGQYDRALGVAQEIESDSVRSWALGEISVRLSEAGQDRALGVLNEVLEAVRDIEDAYWRAWALRGVAVHLAEIGQHDYALKVTHEIEVNLVRVTALGELAGRLVVSGQRDRALHLLDEALKLAQGIDGASDRAWALGKVAGRIATAGQRDRATEIVQGIEEIGQRAKALRQMVESLAEAKFYDYALEVVQAIEEASERALALQEITGQLAKAGQYDSALEVALGIGDAYWQAEALREVAVRLVESEQHDWALKVARGTEPSNRAAIFSQVILSTGFETYVAAHAALDEMWEIALSYTSLTRQFTMPAVSRALGRFRRFRQALSALEGQDANKHLECIAAWVPALEDLREGLTVQMIDEVQRIGEWSRHM